jgi:hypothetical protein
MVKENYVNLYEERLLLMADDGFFVISCSDFYLD